MLGACTAHSCTRSKRSARIGSDGVGANSGTPRLLFYEGIRRLTSARWEHHRCLDLASGVTLAGEVLVTAGPRLLLAVCHGQAGRRGGLGFRQDVRCVVIVSVQLARLSFLVCWPGAVSNPLLARLRASKRAKGSGIGASQRLDSRRDPIYKAYSHIVYWLE